MRRSGSTDVKTTSKGLASVGIFCAVEDDMNRKLIGKVAPWQQGMQTGEQLLLGDAIERGCGFIQNQDARALQNRSRDPKTLALAPG